jgi:dUTP pyrophosphatase
MVSLRNPLKEELRLGKGDRFCQGVFLPYGLAEEEDRPGERKGGFGSTGK